MYGTGKVTLRLEYWYAHWLTCLGPSLDGSKAHHLPSLFLIYYQIYDVMTMMHRAQSLSVYGPFKLNMFIRENMSSECTNTGQPIQIEYR